MSLTARDAAVLDLARHNPDVVVFLFSGGSWAGTLPKPRRMEGCRLTVRGLGKGRALAEALVALEADEAARSDRPMPVETVLDPGAEVDVESGQSHDGYGSGGSARAPPSSLDGTDVERYDVMNGIRGRSSWSGSNLYVSGWCMLGRLFEPVVRAWTHR